MKKGFTLIELLAVIVILAIIALIATPIIFDIITDSKEKAKQITYQNIERATDLYIRSEYDIKGISHPEALTLKELIDKGYLENIDEDLNNKVLIITNFDEYKPEDYLIYYEGRNKSENFKTLKEVILSDTKHIKKGVTINGHPVDKVYGTKSEQTTMKNYVLFSGQLMEVLEIDNTNNKVKLVSAAPLTQIAYGETNEFESSTVRKWLNEEFYQMLERKDLIKGTTFCVDNIDVTPDCYTKMDTCTNELIEKVGLLTYEDYIYAKDGSNIQNGGSFLDNGKAFYTMTPTSTTNIVWYADYTNPSKLIIDKSNNGNGIIYTTSNWGLDIYPVISISSDVLVESGEGTRSNPYILNSERRLRKDDYLNLGKVGDYVYMDESKNPYANEITETLIQGVTKKTSTSKVRYRIVSINEDGTVKLERADILRNLPSTIAPSGYKVPFYSIDGGDAQTSCLYNTAHKYGTSGLTGDRYLSACTNHNIFNPDEGSGDFERDTGENIGYYLNNASNSFYNWYSDKSKEMIIKTNYDVKTGYLGTLIKSIEVYVSLPSIGEMYTGSGTVSLLNNNPVRSEVIYSVRNTGYFTTVYISDDGVVQPVIILKKDVFITSGDGTVNNPYTLSI